MPAATAVVSTLTHDRTFGRDVAGDPAHDRAGGSRTNRGRSPRQRASSRRQWRSCVVGLASAGLRVV
jgi:hypothetical protein